MKRVPLFLVIPALIFLIAGVPGCPKPATTSASKKSGPTGGDKLEPIKNYEASIKGVVVYDGTAPKMEAIEPPEADKVHCLEGPPEEKHKQTWVVNDGKVANVVVFLKAPSGKFFLPKEEDRKKEKPVELRQPYCAFRPHVLVLFPSFLDESGNEQETGQKLKVINDSKTLAHNTKIPLADKNSGTMDKDKDVFKEWVLPPRDDVYQASCDIHNWMTANILSFDHPLAAVTGKDGTFEIKNAPADIEVSVMVWHEALGKWEHQNKKLSKGENDLGTIKIKAK